MKQKIFFVFALLIIFLFNVFLQYKEFLDFKSKKYLFLEAKVEQNYQKPEKNHNVLRLKTKNYSFYTTTKQKINSNFVKIGVITKNVDFKSYLSKIFYMPNFKLSQMEDKNDFRTRLSNKLKSLHEDEKIANLYSALYLATPINKELRQNVTNWGIAHIIAISGFHLSLLCVMIFFILKPIYKYFQNKFFPYRDANFDIFIFIFIFCGFYLWILDFTPSFLRSFLMSVIGFLFVCRGLNVFAMKNLLICVLIAISFSPSLIFSLGFYFSVLGVFCIFLYIRHFGDKKDLQSPLKILLHSLFLNIYVCFSMNTPVYYFFNSASLYQLSVIPLGYVFSVFYPLSIILHLIGFGDIFDNYLLSFLNYAHEQTKITVNLFYFLMFNVLLFVAIKSKIIAIFLALFGAFIYFVAFFKSMINLLYPSS